MTQPNQTYKSFFGRRKMNRAVSDRRLLRLAGFLEALPRKRFDYSRWVGDNYQGAQDLSCGTTACALGWAATMPEFRRLGLRLSSHSRYDGSLYGYVENTHVSELCTGSSAGAVVFGLETSEAQYLFSPGYPSLWDGLRPAPLDTATPKQVAAHIRRFIKFRASNAA